LAACNSLLTEVYPRLNAEQRERVKDLVSQWNRLKADLLLVAHPSLTEPHLWRGHEEATK
jgi:hypothetical protein